MRHCRLTRTRNQKYAGGIFLNAKKKKAKKNFSPRTPGSARTTRQSAIGQMLHHPKKREKSGEMKQQAAISNRHQQRKCPILV
jgi:hypothetical protein